MIKVLWVSRHPPLPAQIKALEALYGSGTITFKDNKPFSNAQEIIQRFEQGHFDEMVVVAPLSVIAQLTQRGITPLWAEMNEVHDEKFKEDSDVLIQEGRPTQRHMRFQRFRMVKRVALEFDELFDRMTKEV